MATTLQANAVMTFMDYFIDGDGVHLHFVCNNPGSAGAQVNDYTITLTFAEVSGITTQQSAVTLVTGRLQRDFRASGIGSKLDGLIGQSLTI